MSSEYSLKSRIAQSHASGSVSDINFTIAGISGACTVDPRAKYKVQYSRSTERHRCSLGDN